MTGRLAPTKGNNKAIVSAIEKDRPVRPGHHQATQTAAILRWLAKKEKK